mmetsp:Transcript_21650/g.69720  ORF Transcript_21650/g.69720 Transcript_21650/m.69720 type:complete len:166 (+) Transcript_21650:81-578(+)|eukprot:CAMPEP_0118903508 /NCGR_PEP_ID=MMETSP1166-20130328/8347_1 /TAXON_ID=1104430 /ORGANISM="Chrysoreinhardia sp, Strain CCMP3193" /LENGTH=165 /DNA_ID=CAMNT_0006842735 /DNA_START=64 /DNA_END=561 /DNA_ORIENTATION=+
MTNQMQREAFTKGFENKWMVCEDGGIFLEPSGKHSERIGELKVGDVVEADAETFDPDNKVIWRLKAPMEGWIYAPVRGPKTCVPLTAETLKLTQDGVKFYKVTGKKGTIVRAEKELDSEQVKIIPQDSVCYVVDEATLDSGKERFKINKPVEGWITQSQVTRWYC